ncbi:MAG TPA: alanine--tRNA ligase [Thermoanaerobaculia bacterium]|nr:alanine--tRNA ligase [Thermoanaerobaculia bacterium]
MKGSDIRQSFLDFFAERGHRVYPSAPLVPQSDPTLLFTNAGMVPFKNFFLGIERPPQRRATSVQKSLRVSGKHNDLENVGPSPRHHTFFEMLGNFSFGDYFKAEAIELAWELVTRVWGLDPEVLYATVYEEDDEAFALWRRIAGLPEARIVRCGREDNFWAMGETGPCGPCSEIHIDLAPREPAVAWAEGSASGRYFEFWNLVFMQFDAKPGGELEPLPNPSIDTGAGLERVAAVLQGVPSNYDTDLFRPLLLAIAELAERRYGVEPGDDLSMRVVADHLRAVGFLLADGVVPGNEGRGYVLRRILRRAVRHGLRLGLERPFLDRLLPVLAETMPEYPELAATREASGATVRVEEEKFRSTVAAASRHVQELVEAARTEGRSRLEGDEAFRLYDTFGLPIELVREILEEEGFTLDEEGFRHALERQRERSRSATRGAQGQAASLRAAVGGDDLPATVFQGYDLLEIEGASVLRLAREEGGAYQTARRLGAGERGILVLDRTVFYAEAGGQVGDTGTAASSGARLIVRDTQKDGTGLVYHYVEVTEGVVVVGASLALRVDAARRRRTERNHTATHLLHASLRQRLGLQVRQAGSLVHPDRLRFDFTFDRPLAEAERDAVEDLVREWVWRAVPTVIEEREYPEAIARGAMALFGEKYGERVRTVEVPGWSLELCGGCHVRNTGEIGSFRIVSERGVASGVRRIEALSGDAAESLARDQHRLLRSIESELAVPADRAPQEIASLKDRLRQAEREIERLRLRQIAGGDGESADEEIVVDGVKVVAREVAPAPLGQLRSMADLLRQRLGSGVVVLGAREEEKVSVVVTVTADLTARVDAGQLARRLGALVGGAGGGRSDFAQAGGKDPERLTAALQAVPAAVEGQLRGDSRASA